MLCGILKRYNLEQYRDTMAGKLSGGYKRRLALVCALAHDPLVLFLDEPTAGIAPVRRKLLWDDFYALSMEEAQRYNELAFLAQGEIVATGTPTTIKKALGNVTLLTINLPYTPLTQEYLSDIKGIILINQFEDELRIMLNADTNHENIQKILEEKLGVTTNLMSLSSRPHLSWILKFFLILMRLKLGSFYLVFLLLEKGRKAHLNNCLLRLLVKWLL